jgi:cytochrome P450
MNDATATLTRHADVMDVLFDRRCVVAPVPESSGSGVAWLRAHVFRFSNGPMHARRRALAEARLAACDPVALRRRAHKLSTMEPAMAPARATVTVLSAALGIDPAAAPLIAEIAPSYFPGSDVPGSADDAVRELVTSLGGRFDEETATVIGLLVQSHEATAGLVANTLAAYDRHGEAPVEAMLVETLRHDSPIHYLRRVCAAPYGAHVAQTHLELDIAAANRDPEVFADPERFDPYRPDGLGHLTFGAGLRPCPGRVHALAIAAGIVEAMRGSNSIAG